MTTKKITYAGNTLLGINFGLYDNDNIDFMLTKNSIKDFAKF